MEKKNNSKRWFGESVKGRGGTAVEGVELYTRVFSRVFLRNTFSVFSCFND